MLPAIAALAACATTGSVKHAREEAAANLAVERSERIAADNQLAESDSLLREELRAVRGDVKALRADLQQMKTEFNAKITALEIGMQFDMPVNFAFDDAGIRAQDQPMLDRFSKIVSKYYTGSKVTVEGFTDPAGSDAYNMMLSRRRADAVRYYLSSHGLVTSQISSVGYGKTRPVTPGASRDAPGAEANRRVVFVIESRPQRAVALVPPPKA
jgi:peptidoglycan-associated lipoprotein